MLKKLFFVAALFMASAGFAFAQVDVNKADQTALDGIKGIGPKTSKAILDERKKGGDFKDWADFQKRVSGIGEKNSAKLSQAGLTINGLAKVGASAPEAKASAPKAAKEGAAKKEHKTAEKPAQAAGSDGSDEKSSAAKPAKAALAAGSDSTSPKKLQAKGSASASASATQPQK